MGVRGCGKSRLCVLHLVTCRSYKVSHHHTQCRVGCACCILVLVTLVTCHWCNPREREREREKEREEERENFIDNQIDGD
jgi:hypothetical protein